MFVQQLEGSVPFYAYLFVAAEGYFPPRGMRRFMNQPPLRVLLLSRLRSEQKMDYYDSLRSFHLAIFRLKNSSNEKPKNLQERKVENS